MKKYKIKNKFSMFQYNIKTRFKKKKIDVFNGRIMIDTFILAKEFLKKEINYS